jgi:hypothetical protein
MGHIRRQNNGPAPHRKIVELLKAIPAVDAQNRLLRLGDKELAMSLLYMAEHEQRMVISLLGEAKGKRVSEELDRQLRSRVAAPYYEAAVRTVVRTLEGAAVDAPKSYYRPATASYSRDRR